MHLKAKERYLAVMFRSGGTTNQHLLLSKPMNLSLRIDSSCTLRSMDSLVLATWLCAAQISKQLVHLPESKLPRTLSGACVRERPASLSATFPKWSSFIRHAEPCVNYLRNGIGIYGMI